MSDREDRDSFIELMRLFDEGNGIHEQISDPPSEEQVRRFFSYFNGAPPENAIDFFETYMRLFYVHGGPTITYPGGQSLYCDSLTEVFSARIENGYRIIDCEGYAVAGVELLTIAGFRLVEYILVIELDRCEGHTIACMRMPQGAIDYIFISNGSIYRDFDSALLRLGFNRTARGYGRTIREAMEDLNLNLIYIESRIEEMTENLRRRHQFR